jgi:ABC-type transport system involved in multi-copper enzyme maturation permease subunit
MKTTIKYVILTAVRDWLFIAIIAALGMDFFLSKFLASTALIEKNQMFISFLAGTSRVLLIAGITIFICFHVRRAFENKEIDLMLSRPISRSMFVVSYWLGFCIVSLLILFFLSLTFLIFLDTNMAGLASWVISMAFELMIISAFAVFASVILKSSVTSVLLTAGFYIISRMIGFFGYVLQKHYSGDIFSFDFISQKIVWLISFLLPRLDLFAQTDWLIYGPANGVGSWYLPIIQSVIYIPILLFMAAADFKRKQF